VIFRRQLEKLKWYGYVKKEERKAVCPKEGKVQQSSKSIAKEWGKQGEIRQTFKMLREV